MDEMPIGRYGTVHYMSNNGSEVPLASYPVDEEVISLGRSDHNTCHIRLIDRWCSDIHCKLIFDEGKAFLVVLGQNGVVIDGSDFLPSGNETSPTTVPLTNGSEWLIFKRRFIFQYPPKDQRAKLMATPRPKSRKSLRMSMINAAHVWTPSVPRTQEESLRYFKTPISPFADEKDLKVTLVEGDALHVAHNDEDIVVMENVDSPQPQLLAMAPPASPAKVPQTPGKRGPPSLHRQVLLMNSHRKHVKQVDELEEREVEQSVMFEQDSDEELEEDAASNPFISKEPSQTTPDESEKSLDSTASGSSLNARSFRASLGAIGSILPFGRPSGAVVHSPDQREKAPAAEDAVPATEGEMGLDSTQTPSNKRTLGSFFTPQAVRGDSDALPRQSLGGNAVQYMDVDQDLEQARRRLAELGPVSRPKLVQVSAEEEPTKPRTVPRSAKKPRHTLADIPELSSPLPGAKGKFNAEPMESIPEPTTSEPKEDSDGDEGDSAFRLQKLMRTVENVSRRESIRESRRSVVDPVDFYSTRADPASPIKREEGAAAHTSKRSSGNGARDRSLKGRELDVDSAMLDVAEESARPDTPQDDETSAKESEVPSTKKGRKPAKSTTKRIIKSKQAVDEGMELDEPESVTQDVDMEDHTELPKKKTRGVRKATEEPAPAARARRGKKAATNVEDEIDSVTAQNSVNRGDSEDFGGEDEGSAAIAGDDELATTRTRRAPQGKKTAATAQAKEDASTAKRRVGRSKPATSTILGDTPAHAESSATAANGLKKIRTVSRKVKTEVAEPILEDGDDELDLLSSDAPTRPTVRKRLQTESSIDQSEDSQEPGTKRTTRKTPAARKTKTATPAPEPEKENDSDTPAPAPIKSRRVQKPAKEIPVAEEAPDTKPRRTTRTKR